MPPHVPSYSIHVMKRHTYYPNSSWKTFFVGQNKDFSPEGVLNMDARSYYYYIGSGNSPSCFMKSIGHLSQYASLIMITWTIP
jgi:hypothetical protein